MEEKKHKSILTSPEIVAEYVYESSDLDFDAIKKNPILKPISEINKNYCDLQIIATKAILEYEEEYKKIQELETANPRYTNTVLMATIRNMINLFKTIVHSQDLQNISMKSTINEMVKINDEKYKLIDNETEKIEKIKEDLRKELEDEYKEKIVPQTKSPKGPNIPDSDSLDKTEEILTKEEEKILSDLKKIVGEEETNEKETGKKKESSKKTYSSLLEREL